MDAGGITGLVIGLSVVALVTIIVLANMLYVVRQAEGIVIERFGKFHRVLGSGLNAVVPFVDRPRRFTWTVAGIDVDGRLINQPLTGYRIDLRESLFNFLRQEVYTRDTVLLDVNALMFYRIVDVRKAIYEVEDLQAALSNTAQTQLKEVFGNLLFTDALKSQEEISEHLSREFGKLFHTWGIHVERMELLDLMPKAQTQAVMRKQMIAERNRRAEFIRSEGKKTALRLQAEGERIVRFNLGMAQQEATKRVSEAEREARIAVAAAESAALVSVAKAATQDGSSNVQYQVSQRFMGMIQAMGSSMDSATIYLPYDDKLMRGLVGKLSDTYGAAKAPRATGGAPPHPGVPAPKNERSATGQFVELD